MRLIMYNFMVIMQEVLYLFIVFHQIVIYFDVSNEVRLKIIYIYIYSIERNNVFITLAPASFGCYDQCYTKLKKALYIQCIKILS